VREPDPLSGRVALVTGSSHGLGRQIAGDLARMGATVALCGRDRSSVESAARDLQDGGHLGARGFACDVTMPAAVVGLMSAVSAGLGPVDILVNNVGGYPSLQTTVETTPAEWDDLVRLNLTAAFLCTREVLPSMVDRGFGRIVNIGSEAGRNATFLNSPAYAAAKAGLAGLTKHTAQEVAAAGITVNLIHPGALATERNRGLWEQAPGGVDGVLSTIPVGRAGDFREVSALVAYLVGPDGGYMTGATLDVNGGRAMP